VPVFTVSGNIVTTMDNLYADDLLQGSALWVRAGETITGGGLTVDTGSVEVLGLGAWPPCPQHMHPRSAGDGTLCAPLL
jgi:hypothetical protein